MIGIGRGLDTQVPKIMMYHQTQRGLKFKTLLTSHNTLLPPPWLPALDCLLCAWVDFNQKNGRLPNTKIEDLLQILPVDNLRLGIVSAG